MIRLLFFLRCGISPFGPAQRIPNVIFSVMLWLRERGWSFFEISTHHFFHRQHSFRCNNHCTSKAIARSGRQKKREEIVWSGSLCKWCVSCGISMLQLGCKDLWPHKYSFQNCRKLKTEKLWECQPKQNVLITMWLNFSHLNRRLNFPNDSCASYFWNWNHTIIGIIENSVRSGMDRIITSTATTTLAGVGLSV